MNINQLLQTALIGIDIIASREVSAIIRLAGLPPLRTRGMTDALRALDFYALDRPDSRKLSSGPVRVWHVPGLGVSVLYTKPHITREQVQKWLKARRAALGDRRKTRHEGKPGRCTLARLRTNETERLAEWAAQRRGETLCEVCKVRVCAFERRQCNSCIRDAGARRAHAARVASGELRVPLATPVPAVPGCAACGRVHITGQCL